ncbi:CBS domain containing-hemolysin-like protein [Paenibacillus phyllosphaerae]|uniref:CBS domain containing-hemolysin-like protein n=1 Tax=Paenibacillus phyllosphaerae TaxID=274593 RepID=A0A7W5AT34_9BACL|nr:hemolysin family protein [Paenibacillus phyllosphaerae]MBB3108290.1 CBS domain containing-hemolysin-like protein [Paenibacillus phyllosphaerae]
MPHTEFELVPIVLNLLLVVVLVFLNGLFVAAEFSLVKVRQSRLTQLTNEGNKRARYALKVNQKLDAYLSATQLGITLASLGLGWVGEPAISELIVEPLFHQIGIADGPLVETISVIIGFVVITFLHIVLGELAPKSLAIRKSEETSLWLSIPLLWFYRLFLPAIFVLNGTANRLLRIIGIEPASEHDSAHTEEEIRILMDQSAKSGIIDSDEMKLFDNIFEFSDRLAREIMLPRTDMDCLNVMMPFDENMKLVYQTRHTRFPVCVDDKDQIIGFVHITDLLTADPDEDHQLTKFLRPILNVPESMEISQVLRLMQRKHSQLAIVVDEYGGTAGMLTTELILEEIVGEIHDEFDTEQPSVVVNGEITSVDGRMLIEEVNDMFNLDIEDEDVDSIGGWLFTKLEGNPVKGKKIEYDGFVFEVAESAKLRVHRVHIYRQAPIRLVPPIDKEAELE